LKHIRTVIGVILILAGIVALAYNPYKNYQLGEASEKSQNVLQHLSKDDVAQNKSEPATFNYEDVHPITLSAVLDANKDKTKINAIGEIAIPELGINLPIINGVSDYNMLRGATTLSSHQQMGVGNYSLASHYSPAQGGRLLFSPLVNAKPGMRIYITDMDKIYTYKIESITLVDPTDVHVLDETGENIITLVTCNDLNGQKRRIVRGKLLNISDVKSASDNITKVFQTPIRTY
jgi:sortase A